MVDSFWVSVARTHHRRLVLGLADSCDLDERVERDAAIVADRSAHALRSSDAQAGQAGEISDDVIGKSVGGVAQQHAPLARREMDVHHEDGSEGTGA